MDPSNVQHQEMATNPLENMFVCQTKAQNQERKPRPQPEQALKCPRCDSTNTKFCYYNNYSLSQPRYFCKSCRRYWTKGGTLRNVPVGGGCRKNKRLSSSKKSQDYSHQINPNSNLFTTYDSNDLTVAFARLQKQSSLGFDENDHMGILGNSNNNGMILGNPNPSFLGFLDNNHFQNGYFGYGGLENNSGICTSGEMIFPYNDNRNHQSSSEATQAVTVTTMKDEFCDNGNGRVLFGLPWQINGNNLNEIESAGRESWSQHGVLGNSNWHGIMNTPLV